MPEVVNIHIPAAKRAKREVRPLDPNALAYSPSDAARALSCSKRHVERLIASGVLRARKSGSRVLVEAASVREYFDSLPAVDRPKQ